MRTNILESHGDRLAFWPNPHLIARVMPAGLQHNSHMPVADFSTPLNAAGAPIPTLHQGFPHGLPEERRQPVRGNLPTDKREEMP